MPIYRQNVDALAFNFTLLRCSTVVNAFCMMHAKETRIYLKDFRIEESSDCFSNLIFLSRVQF